jgi:hypothetical protein
MKVRCIDSSDNVIFEGEVYLTDEDAIVIRLAGEWFGYERTDDDWEVYRIAKAIRLPLRLPVRA